MKINDQILEQLRSDYPKGCRIKLLKMDDPCAPPLGTYGTVIGVDDIGSIMVSWDTGSQLSLLFGIDRFQKISE